MKRTLLQLLLAFVCVGMFAQEENAEEKKSPWTLGTNGSFIFNQIALKNWAAGGKNSIAGTFLFKTFANYKSEKATWDNTLDMGYGMMKYNNEDLQKSEDKILLQSIYGYDAAKQKLFYSGSFDFKTQFANGYEYKSTDTTLVSKGFSPAYINLSLGMLYKPCDWFSFFLSPLTMHMTIVGDTLLSPRYGVDSDKHVRAEYGASAKILVDKKNIVKNVDYYLRCDLFSNLTDHPEHIDVDAETGFNLNVNSWLTAVVKVNLLFDDDIKHIETYKDAEGNTQSRQRGARLQVKELFGFGLHFKWDNIKKKG